MNFDNDYNLLKQTVGADLDILECQIKNIFSDKNELNQKLLELICAPSKRLRPLVGFLFLRTFLDEISENQMNCMLAVELIHNATLIHDDVIDNSKLRRSKPTINSMFDDNLAVVAGDYLLSISMQKVIQTKSIEVLELFTGSLKSTCLGEINQYFSKNKITTIDEYVEKSKNKTALLFESAVLGGILLSNIAYKSNLIKIGSDFARNFGIAFQIRDDLINIMDSDSKKPAFIDFESGIYTAPVIYAYENNNKILESGNVLEEIKSNCGIVKTKSLMDNYFESAIDAIRELENNNYKFTIIKLIELLRTSV